MSSFYLNYCLDLDRDIQGQAIDAHSRSCVFPFVPENLSQHIAAAIHNLWLVLISINTIHEGSQFDELFDLVQVSELGCRVRTLD